MPFNLAEGETSLSSTQWENGEVTVTTSRLMFSDRERWWIRRFLADASLRQYLPLEMIDSVRVGGRRMHWLLRIVCLVALLLFWVPPFIGLVVGGILLLYAWWIGRYTAIGFHAGDQMLAVYAYCSAADPRVQELLDAVEAARQSLLERASPSAPSAPPAPVRVTLNP